MLKRLHIEPESEISPNKKVKKNTIIESEKILLLEQASNANVEELLTELKVRRNWWLNDGGSNVILGPLLANLLHVFNTKSMEIGYEEALSFCANNLTKLFREGTTEIIARKLVEHFIEIDFWENTIGYKQCNSFSPVEIEEIYDSAWQHLKIEPIDESKVIDLIKLALEEKLSFRELPLENREFFTTRLPIKNGALAKHYLPFIPSLHIRDVNDSTIENMTCGNVIIRSPSGMGKTSLIVRLLCKHPGLLITGTGKNEYGNGETTDASVRAMLNRFSNRVESFAYIRQAIQILMISKLIYIISLIEDSRKNPKVLETFEGNQLAFLVFNQFTGSSTQAELFRNLFNDLKNANIQILRAKTIELIYIVKERTSSKKFSICVDEANVLEEHCGYDFLSINGNKRGALSVMCNEILKVNAEGLNIYAGTGFSVDISDIVQTNIGNAEGIVQLTEFDYLDNKLFIEYLKKHINIESSSFESFPLRIRQAALCLEYFINYALENGETKPLETCLSETFSTMIQQLDQKATQFLDSHKANMHFRLEYESILYDYILCFENPELCGSSFYIPSSEMASHFLNSGIACPVAATVSNRCVEFKSVDVLGYKFALSFLGRAIPSVSDGGRMALAKYFGMTECRKMFETSIILALTVISGKLSERLALSNINEPLVRKLLKMDFKCERVFTCNGFVEFCKQNKWIDNSNTKPGDQLYFEFAVEHKERIVNILFRPSSDDDAILALLKNNDLIFLRFRFTNKQQDYGYKSMLPHVENSISVIFHLFQPNIDQSINSNNVVFIKTVKDAEKLLGKEFTDDRLVPFLKTVEN